MIKSGVQFTLSSCEFLHANTSSEAAGQQKPEAGKLSRDYFCRINYAKNCKVVFFPDVANAESFQMVNSGMRLALRSFSLLAEIVLDDCGCCIAYGRSPCLPCPWGMLWGLRGP